MKIIKVFTDIIFIHPLDNVDSFKKESKHYYTVSKSEDNTYEDVFEDIIKDYGVIDAILYFFHPNYLSVLQL